MFRYHTLDDFDFKGKIVGIRVDINSPIINNKVEPNERIIASAKTIKELSDKGAKVVVIAHQGRKGDDDCISLENHKPLLEKELGKKIEFCNEIFSKKIEEKILSLKNSDILLLENLRFYDDEEDIKKKDNLILKLESLFEFYVFDAFSVSHREQTSVIGFKKILSIAGRTMQKEIEGLNKISQTKKPHIYLFGGAKPDDLVVLIENSLKLKKVDIIILSGVIGEIALHLQGCDIGKKLDFLKEKKYLNSLDLIKNLLEKYPNNFILPKDVAYFDGKKRVEISVEKLKSSKGLLKDYLIQDIGCESVKYFSKFLDNAGSIYFKGPAGNFEDKNFEYGTRQLINYMAKSSAFTFLGGGHSVTAISNFSKIENFSYVSLAGGALVKFLSGKSLPGITNLEESFEKFDKVYQDFVVVGSNTIDTELVLPVNFDEVHLGDKIKIEEDFKTSIGGGGINVSVCLSRLGAKVGYLGKLSYESFDKIKEVLDKNRINLINSKISKRPAAKSILIDTKDNDRVIYTYRGQNSHLEKTDFNSEDFKSNNYYFTSLGGESFETLYDLSKLIIKKNPNAKICYNPSLYLIKNESSKIKNMLKNVHILILNYQEAESLVGDGTISYCLKEIYKIMGKGVIIITDGANGSYAYDGEKEYYQPIIKPKKVVDTTGAGDSFGGTFFYFYSKGFGIKKALLFASKNASSVVEYKGAQQGLKYYEDLYSSEKL